MAINALSSVPQNVVIQTGNGQIFLKWQQVVGATGYTIQRSLTGLSGSFTNLATSVLVNNYLDASVSAGIQYWYQVASNNASGNSSFNSVGTNGLPLTITPCLPGQINLGYLNYMSKLRADKLNSEFLTDDEWNFNIQQSTYRLYDLLVQKYGERYFLATPLQIPSNGTSVYPIPDGILYGGAPAQYKLAGVDVAVGLASNGQWFTLPQFNWEDRNKYSTLQLAGTIQSVYGLQYCEFGNNIYFIPIPNGGQTFQLWYVPVLKQMLQDTDMMPFSISGWSELVIVDAAIKALIKEESFEQAASLIEERRMIIERIEVSASNRNIGTPNTVSNTRANSGDPNFGSVFGGWGAGGGGGSGWT